MARPRTRPGAGPADDAAGMTLVELLFVLGAIAAIGVAAVPMWWQATARSRTLGAVRSVAATLHAARTDAVAKGTTVAVRFVPSPDGAQFATYLDANRDGISTADILAGRDPLVTPARGIGEFGGVRFGVWPGILAPDGSDLSDGDPIRVGVSDFVSFTPAGTATAGSLYVRGPEGLQYVIRIRGDTGKTQVLRYARGERTWVTQ